MGDSSVERLHIEQFLSLVPDIEILDFDRQSPPEPDFYAQTNLGFIGIEHTQLFKRIDQNNVNPALHENEGERIAKEAKELFESKSDHKVFVSISYRLQYGRTKISEPIWLSSKKRKVLVPIIVDFVIRNIPENGSFSGFANPDWKGEYILPIEICDLSISHKSNLPTTNWSTSDGHLIPDIFSGSNFWDLLEKKNKKVHKYQKHYDQIWLVLVSDNRKIASDFKMYNPDLPKINSSFGKVLIYCHGDKTYYELPKIAG